MRVCPWWLGYLLVCPLRRLSEDPSKIVAPYVREGMTVLEPGPGMGFFTLELARRVGAAGRVIAVDVQPKMLSALARRLERAGLERRVQSIQALSDSLHLPADTSVDFTLAFAVVHELRDVPAFFREVAQASRPGAKLLISEPKGHVSAKKFEQELGEAERAGFTFLDHPSVGRNHAGLLFKS